MWGAGTIGSLQHDLTASRSAFCHTVAERKWRASPHIPDRYLAYTMARIRKGLEELRGKKHPVKYNNLFFT